VADPETVREKMKRASEPVYDFAAVCLTDAEDDVIPKDDVRGAYREYARQENLPARSDNVLGEKLLNLRDYAIEDGRKRIDGDRQTVYKGVAFTSRGAQCAGYDPDTDDAQESIKDGGPQGRADTIAELVDRLDDGDGVRKDMILAGAQGQNMSKLDAQKAFEKAKAQGKITQIPSGNYEVS